MPIRYYQPGDYDNTILRKFLENQAATLAPSSDGSLATAVTSTPATGYTRFRGTALAATAVAVKASAGAVYAVNLINVNTVPVYVKFYDLAAGSVVVGTTVPVLTIAIPAGDGSTPGIVLGELVPKSFAVAISVAAVTGLADSSTAAPSTAVHASLDYK